MSEHIYGCFSAPCICDKIISDSKLAKLEETLERVRELIAEYRSYQDGDGRFQLSTLSTGGIFTMVADDFERALGKVE